MPRRGPPCFDQNIKNMHRHIAVTQCPLQHFAQPTSGFSTLSMRIMLAAIKHNMHLSTGKQLNAPGDEHCNLKFCQCIVQQFHVLD